MKKILAVLLVLLLLPGLLSPALAVEEATELQAVLMQPDTIANIFPDTALAQSVADHLGVSLETTVTQVDLDWFWWLNAHNLGIQNLQGIQFLRNLEWLALSSNQISDLRPLAGLTNLETLSLWGNRIHDISPLVGLTNLWYLNLNSQSIRRDPVPWNDTLVLPNLLRDANGNSFAPCYIFDDGVYSDGQLVWNSLPRVRSASYWWDHFVHIGSATATFTGWSHNSLIGALPFHDVSPDDWFYNHVWYMFAMGFMVGTSETTFDPHGALDRAMIATILHRTVWPTPDVPFRPIFSDISPGHWYSEAVTWAYDTGIVQGMGDNRFAPHDSLTREQLATMMHRLAPIFWQSLYVPEHIDNVAGASPWAQEAMRWAVYRGFIDSGENPRAAATRAEAAFFVSLVAFRG